MQKTIQYVVGGLLALTGCENGEFASYSSGVTVARSGALSAGGDSDVADLAAGVRRRCPDDLPAALNPSADATITAVLPARGVQIYNCAAPAAGGDPVWTLKAPHAVPRRQPGGRRARRLGAVAGSHGYPLAAAAGGVEFGRRTVLDRHLDPAPQHRRRPGAGHRLRRGPRRRAGAVALSRGLLLLSHGGRRRAYQAVRGAVEGPLTLPSPRPAGEGLWVVAVDGVTARRGRRWWAG